MYSSCKIKNISNEVITISGKEFQVNEIYQIQDSERLCWSNESSYIEDLLGNETIEIYSGETKLEIKTALSVLNNNFDYSFAVDKSNTDQELTSGSWIEVSALRKIWDIGNIYDIENNDIEISCDGIYFHDGQIRIKDIVSVESIELALFKRQTPEDDYWFILDKKIITAETSVQLSSSTLFDFYEDEQYCLKIYIAGEGATCTIDGSDDFTAWGLNFTKSMYV